MESLHQVPDSVIVKVDVIHSLDGEIENSPVRIDRLDCAIGGPASRFSMFPMMSTRGLQIPMVC
jgi:hypothetical protein